MTIFNAHSINTTSNTCNTHITHTHIYITHITHTYNTYTYHFLLQQSSLFLLDPHLGVVQSVGSGPQIVTHRFQLAMYMCIYVCMGWGVMGWIYTVVYKYNNKYSYTYYTTNTNNNTIPHSHCTYTIYFDSIPFTMSVYLQCISFW